MKNLIKLFALTLLIIGFSVSSFGQVNATATSTATIIVPITITKTVDMNFGNIAVSSTSGTVILEPNSTRTITGGVILPSITGTVSAATFTISGLSNSTYSITLPTGNHTIIRQTGSETMWVHTFISSPTLVGTLDGRGSQILTVGSTLNVDAEQIAGTYISGTAFVVTVNYN